MSDQRILFLFDGASPFVRADEAILRERYEVEAVDGSNGSSLGSMARALLRADLSYSWFALGHAARAVLLGKLFRRPSVVVTGGWDVAAMPEIAYGAARSPRGRARARLVLRGADTLVTFSAWSGGQIRRLSGREPLVVPLGVDLASFRPASSKEDLIVSVGNVTRENLVRKGHETFVRAAALLPRVRFVLAGNHVDDAAAHLRAIATRNVGLPGRLEDAALRDLFARAKVYVQASYTEGFGLAVAEAMAAGCVPVVTRNGSLPEVVGDTGEYAPFGDIEATADAVRRALESDRGAAARRRVEANFPIARRRERVLRIVGSLLGA